MPHARHHSWTGQTGLSLIEIMVGISIMAIVAFAVTLSMQPAANPLDREADRLAVRLNQAAAEAIATGVPVGLGVGEGGTRYTFYRYVDRRWWPLRDHPALDGHILDGDVRLDVTGGAIVRNTEDGGAPREIPAIWFDPAGVTDPFVLRLESAGGWRELAWSGGGTIERIEGGRS
ncbi:GspH/FimT family pseudopilin [Maricaulis sp.]|uniref:GspH/FimT family pseudopilin n=1 Tax=Maricaulis sp. TaxID=1486257 RepID=UPI00261A6982|nr:GspH/FimT family pseudopilin [Maricaulis sp.]